MAVIKSLADHCDVMKLFYDKPALIAFVAPPQVFIIKMPCRKSCAIRFLASARHNSSHSQTVTLDL